MWHTLYSLVKEHAAEAAINDPNTAPEPCQGPCQKRVAETLSRLGHRIKDERQSALFEDTNGLFTLLRPHSEPVEGLRQAIERVEVERFSSNRRLDARLLECPSDIVLLCERA